MVSDAGSPFLAVFCKLERNLTFSGAAYTMQEKLSARVTAISATLEERAQLLEVTVSSLEQRRDGVPWFHGDNWFVLRCRQHIATYEFFL